MAKRAIESSGNLLSGTRRTGQSALDNGIDSRSQMKRLVARMPGAPKKSRSSRRHCLLRLFRLCLGTGSSFCPSRSSWTSSCRCQCQTVSLGQGLSVRLGFCICRRRFSLLAFLRRVAAWFRFLSSPGQIITTRPSPALSGLPLDCALCHFQRPSR